MIDTPSLGQVQFVEIGATMVGSVRQTYMPGDTVAKGDEKGYFAFGGLECGGVVRGRSSAV